MLHGLALRKRCHVQHPVKLFCCSRVLTGLHMILVEHGKQLMMPFLSNLNLYWYFANGLIWIHGWSFVVL